MKVLLDTNIIFSALISDGNERLLISKIIGKRHQIVITDLILEELKYVIKRKISKKEQKKVLKIIDTLSGSVFVFVKKHDLYKKNIKKARKYINDKDVPVLAVGLQSEIDAIVSGDKDFVSNKKLHSLRKKKIFTAKEIFKKL